jgi:imidazolonepropionase-like amidohydrolase
MNSTRTGVAAALAAAAMLATMAADVSPTAGGQVPPARAFTGARLIDGDGRVVAERGILVVRNGRVVAAGPSADVVVPAGAETVDLTGRTVMPGLVNAHGHVADTLGLATGPEHYTEQNLLRQLRLYAAYGVTTVVSLGGDEAAGFRLRDASGAPGLDRARLFVGGPIVTASTPEAARADVDRVAALRPDIIKIRVDDNLGTTRKMPIEVARAVIEQARTHGLDVAAHVFYLEDAKALVEAGAAFIAHSIRDAAVDDELIRLLKDRGVCVCPTLTREVSTFVYESEPDFFSDPFFLRHADRAVLEALREPARQARMRNSRGAQQYKVALEVARANVKRLYDAGVGLAFGTDTGPPARFQGYFEHLELDMLERAGVPAAAVLAMATGGSADCLKLDEVGYLRPGRWADFLVLTADPLSGVRGARAIESVWISGRRLE